MATTVEQGTNCDDDEGHTTVSIDQKRRDFTLLAGVALHRRNGTQLMVPLQTVKVVALVSSSQQQHVVLYANRSLQSPQAVQHPVVKSGSEMG